MNGKKKVWNSLVVMIATHEIIMTLMKIKQMYDTGFV